MKGVSVFFNGACIETLQREKWPLSPPCTDACLRKCCEPLHAASAERRPAYDRQPCMRARARWRRGACQHVRLWCCGCAQRMRGRQVCTCVCRVSDCVLACMTPTYMWSFILVYMHTHVGEQGCASLCAPAKVDGDARSCKA
jgi:hypothetical protein